MKTEYNNKNTKKFQRSIVESIYRVCYLMLSLKHELTQNELINFKKLFFHDITGVCGDSHVNDFFEEAIKTSEKLNRLSKVYDDDELIKALITKVENDIENIKSDDYYSREAFSIWLTLSFVEEDFGKLKKRVVKALQEQFNLEEMQFRIGLLGMMIEQPKIFRFEELLDDDYSNKDDFPEDRHSIDKITDEFLALLTKYCKDLIYTQKKLAKTYSPSEKSELQSLYDKIISKIDSLIREDINSKNL